MAEQALKGKVARILNAREIVINIGRNEGVEIGMYFNVLDPKGENIKDPDTHEILGSLERPKVKVRITSVQDRLSVASTFRKTEVNVGGRGGSDSAIAASAFALGGLAELLTPPKVIVKYETLKAPEHVVEALDERDSYVKTGDPVVQIIEPPACEDTTANKAVQSDCLQPPASGNR